MRNKKWLSLLLLPLLIGCSSEGSSSFSSVDSSVNDSSTNSATSVDISTQDSTSVSSSSSSSSYSSSSSSSSSSSTPNSSGSPDSSSSEDSSSTSSGTDEVDYETQVFGYQFQSGDIKASGGTLEVNGVTFTYSSSTYIGTSTSDSNQGIQIGSSNNPQTTPWVLSTTFDSEIIINSYSVKLDTAASGSATYTFTLDNFTDSGDFVPDPDVYGNDDLEETTTNLSLSLQSNANKAMYLDYLTFVALVPVDSDIELSNTINNSSDEPLTEPLEPGVGLVPETEYSLITSEEYYSEIDFEMSNDALEVELHDLISDYTMWSYGDARYILLYTDQDIDEPLYLNGIYDGKALKQTWDNGSSWSREHVWPCSRMVINGSSNRPGSETKNHMSDLHNLRAVTPSVNSSRGNNYYDERYASVDCYYPNLSDDEGYDYRGDVARIIFYMYLVNYPELSLVDTPSGTAEMGNLSTLLKWNEEDKVDEFELQRNDRIYQYQGNRNPFIDYPELANRFFS